MRQVADGDDLEMRRFDAVERARRGVPEIESGAAGGGAGAGLDTLRRVGAGASGGLSGGVLPERRGELRAGRVVRADEQQRPCGGGGGQTEAGRSLGMSSSQTMRRIVLPQAIRNMLPALGNDLIAMLKDSSLLSVLAVREMTQRARLYTGTSFDFRATYLVLTFVYLALTLVLSLVLRWISSRMGSPHD